LDFFFFFFFPVLGFSIIFSIFYFILLMVVSVLGDIITTESLVGHCQLVGSLRGVYRLSHKLNILRVRLHLLKMEFESAHYT
jgi:hypothetical protein